MSSDGFDYGRTMAWRSESWVDSLGKISFLKADWVNAGSTVIKYVYKYMVKVPSLKKKAVLTEAKIRTYACSRNINIWLMSMVNDWKEKNKEDLGKVLETGLTFVNTLEDQVKKDNLWQKLKYRWKYTFIVEIEFYLDGEYKNYITIPTICRFDGSVDILTIRGDRDGYHAERGIQRTYDIDESVGHW